MPRFVKHLLSSWGNYPTEEVYDFRPDSPTEINTILSQNGVPSFISRGLGRSYGDASLNAEAGVIRHERLNRFLNWDPESHIVECEAGVTYEDLLKFFLPKGFFPPVTPGTKYVTMGGAVAADVHGKNHHCDGTIASFLESFQLLTGKQEVLTCSRNENADVFWATLGGMGLTGIILTIRLRLLPVETGYIAVEQARVANLDKALEGFTSDKDFRYSVAWIDCLASGESLGRSVLLRGYHAPVSALPETAKHPLNPPIKHKKNVPFRFPGFVLNPLSVKVFNHFYYKSHGKGKYVEDYDTFFYPLDSVLHWNRIYGKRGFVQYQVALPPESSRKALVQILERLSKSGRASFLAVLKNFGPGNEGLLSFPMEGSTLALDLPNTGDSMLKLLDELDGIVLDNGGRVYLAKDARLTKRFFDAMYPRAEEFRQVKAKVDPNNLFSSSLARRVGLA